MTRATKAAHITPAAIKAARGLAGLTQREAAAMLGVLKLTWLRWETGQIPMPAAYWQLWQHLAGLKRIPFRGLNGKTGRQNGT